MGPDTEEMDRNEQKENGQQRGRPTPMLRSGRVAQLIFAYICRRMCKHMLRSMIAADSIREFGRTIFVSPVAVCACACLEIEVPLIFTPMIHIFIRPQLIAVCVA